MLSRQARPLKKRRSSTLILYKVGRFLPITEVSTGNCVAMHFIAPVLGSVFAAKNAEQEGFIADYCRQS